MAEHKERGAIMNQIYDDRTVEIMDYPAQPRIPIHGQQWKSGKIVVPRKMDAVDWALCAAAILAIMILPIGGIIAFSSQGNIIGAVICTLVLLGLSQAMISCQVRENRGKHAR